MQTIRCICHLLSVDLMSAQPYTFIQAVKRVDIIRVFGSNVRHYRELKGISQEKLAELSGLHRTYISDIERFQRSISISNVQKVADALEIEPYKLFLQEE